MNIKNAFHTHHHLPILGGCGNKKPQHPEASLGHPVTDGRWSEIRGNFPRIFFNNDCEGCHIPYNNKGRPIMMFTCSFVAAKLVTTRDNAALLESRIVLHEAHVPCGRVSVKATMFRSADGSHQEAVPLSWVVSLSCTAGKTGTTQDLRAHSKPGRMFHGMELCDCATETLQQHDIQTCRDRCKTTLMCCLTQWCESGSLLSGMVTARLMSRQVALDRMSRRDNCHAFGPKFNLLPVNCKYSKVLPSILQDERDIGGKPRYN